MNFLLIIAAIFIVTETINPKVDEGKDIQKKEVVAKTVETRPAEEINFEAQAEAEAQAAAEAEAQAAAEAEAQAAAEEAEAQAAAEAEAQAAAQAAAEAEAQAAAEAEAEAQAERKEINYLKMALYIILVLAVLTGALLYFRKRDKSLLESKIVSPEQKNEQPVQQEIQPETKEEQPMDNANKEPTNLEELNEDEKK